MKTSRPEPERIKVGGDGYKRLELTLKYDTSDIRQKCIKKNESFIRLRTRSQPPPRPISISIHRSKNNRAYYTCPVCRQPVSMLHYPYDGMYDRPGVWRCAKCMIKGKCGDAVYLVNPSTKDDKLIDRSFIKLADFHRSLASNGYSHKKVTGYIEKWLKILKKPPNNKVIAKLNCRTIIECPQIDTDDRKTLGELKALYAFRNKIITGELLYSKAALNQALNEAVAQ